MKVRWTPEAEADRLAIWDYLAPRDPAASLADFPLRGHAGEVAGTREMTPHRSYRLVYEVVGDTVWILVLIHAARRWPPLGGNEA